MGLKEFFSNLFGGNKNNNQASQPQQQASQPAQQTQPRQPQQTQPKNKSVTFTFNAIPASVDEFCALPEMTLDTPFKTTALALLALLVYENNAQMSIDMLNVLKGPEPLSTYDKQFIKDRLTGKMYKTRSFFKGATPQNNYAPQVPYTVTVAENPYSYPEANRATMWVQSSGADSLRQVTLRKKPSTGEWFLVELQCLADIRIPAAEDKWA